MKQIVKASGCHRIPKLFFTFTINQCIGSFEGVPGLRGYLLGVAATLSMITKDLSRSVQGSGRVVMPLLFPPINDIALIDSLYSISIFVDLYEINMWEFAYKKGVSGFYGSDSEWGTYVTYPVAWAEIDEYKE